MKEENVKKYSKHLFTHNFREKRRLCGMKGLDKIQIMLYNMVLNNEKFFSCNIV